MLGHHSETPVMMLGPEGDLCPLALLQIRFCEVSKGGLREFSREHTSNAGLMSEAHRNVRNKVHQHPEAIIY